MEGDKDRMAEVVECLQTIETVQPANLAIACVSEVYPRLHLGNRIVAKNPERMTELGITHLLNAAHPGTNTSMSVDCQTVLDCVDVNNKAKICYLGLKLSDNSSQDIFSSFSEASDWIQAALEQEGSRVLVNCWAGISRSASLVLAFLMEHRDMTLDQAIKQVKPVRNIMPNRGFLMQLVRYERELGRRRLLEYVE
eukprot:GFUD01019147.1.p1 GENE.GFUD01019147.1~~GFUD01019147.1.p1  ORF type:complete len:196 (+),score=67.54 GFUD01019147.1:134-721(+)